MSTPPCDAAAVTGPGIVTPGTSRPQSYTGSKGQDGTWQRIIGEMPPHSLYIETCCGSAKIFDYKRPAAESVLIDKNPAVFTARVQTPSLRLLLGDMMDLLPSIYLPADALVYVDPPYPLETRQRRIYYDHEPEATDPEWHAKLLALLKTLRCYVMISGVDCPLYLQALQNWRCVQYRTKWHRKVAVENLWCNFAEPTALHDWRFAGRNFRQRTFYKRMAARKLAQLEALPALQSGYVLNAIKEKYFASSDAGTGVGCRHVTPLLALPAASAGNGAASSA
jgi:DNA adenine methylase